MAGFVKDSQKTTTRPDTKQPLAPNSFEWAVAIFAFVLRVGVAYALFNNLADDRDAYLGIAKTIVAGDGYCNPGTDVPTAFRPPLYPLMIAAVSPLGLQFGLAIAHVLLGTSTVWLTMRLGRTLKLGHCSALAGLVVAVNPLLLHYASFPMTETLFTFLVIAWLNCVVRAEGKHSIASGILFGLAALCRPTILAVAPLIGVWLLIKHRVIPVKAGIQPSSSKDSRDSTQNESWLVRYLISIGVSLLIMAPWTIRNLLVFGKPIFATTHGGYTLLLGNNPVFYKNVVRQPWGTTWGDLDGVYEVRETRTQSTWLRGLEKDMQAEGITGEIARDRWMYRRAFNNIQDDSIGFVRSCLLRLGRFWNVKPQGRQYQPKPLITMNVPRDESQPAFLMWSVAAFYSVVLLAAFGGLVRVVISRDSSWAIPLLFCLALTMVHLFYWSNLRMRAPLEPILAVLAIRGIFGVIPDCNDDKS